MKASCSWGLLVVTLIWGATGALGSDGTTAGGDLASKDGRPHNYESPICREARARAEAAAKVPGFKDQLEQIISAVPECFVGWEPGGS